MSTPQYSPPPQYGPQPGPQPQYEGQPQYPPYMHPVPRQPSGIAHLFTGKLVIIGMGIGALLMFIGVIVGAFHGLGGTILVALGAGGGAVASFGGAFFGKEFNREQRLGLYIIAAAFLLSMVLGAGGGARFIF